MNSITHKRGSTILAAIDYTRDDSGNPLIMTDSIGTWNYGYDANNRLVGAVPPNPVPEQPAGGPYEYDWVGNRVRPPRDPSPPSATNQMVYNKADQLVTWPGMHTYTYYGDGSLQYEKNADGTTTLKSYTYTPDNLLATATFDSKTLTNTWDADKNRVGFTVNSTNHTFVYDISAGIPAVIQEDGIYYIREPAGELIARLDGPNMSYYHFDQLGSTRLLTNTVGTVTDEYTYDAYGAVLSHNRSAGSVDQPYQYVGQSRYYVDNTTLTYVKGRYYDPLVGRWISSDPVRFEGGLNLYAYVENRPTAMTDPNGLFALQIVEGYLRLRCLCNALARAIKLHFEHDKIAHCFFNCKAQRCLFPLPPFVVPAILSIPESDWQDIVANGLGGACALAPMRCESCCKCTAGNMLPPRDLNMPRWRMLWARSRCGYLVPGPAL